MAKSDIDIALFASELVENDIKELKSSGTKLIVDPIQGVTKVKGPDISKVQTSEALMEAIMEQSFGVKSEVKKAPKVEPKPEVKIEEEHDAEYYSQELLKLIKQAQSLINEMTSCGSIGVNTAGPGLPNSKNSGMGIKTKKTKKNLVLDKLKKKYRI